MELLVSCHELVQDGLLNILLADLESSPFTPHLYQSAGD
jgi:hypothetical protein